MSKLRVPTATPELPTRGMPATALQGWKIGVIAAHLLLMGYDLKALKPGMRPHKAGDSELVLCAVEDEGVPVGLLASVNDDQVGRTPSQYGLQFAYDGTAVTHTEHWPGTERPQTPTYAALDNDNVLPDTEADSAEDAALEYFKGEYWMGTHALRPERVTVGRLERIRYSDYAAHHAEGIATRIAERLTEDFDHWAEDTADRIDGEHAQAELEAVLQPVIMHWLHRTIGPASELPFYFVRDEQSLPDPQLATPPAPDPPAEDEGQ